MDKVRRDIDYFTRRLSEAGQRAHSATSEPARLAYQQLARLYRGQLHALQGTLRDGEGLLSENRGSDDDG